MPDDTPADPQVKRCPRCGESRMPSAFSKDKSRLDGLSCWCRICCRSVSAARYAANPEKARAERAEYYARNRTKVRDQHAKYYRANKERVSEQGKKYRRAHPDYTRERAAAYRTAHPDRICAASAKWREANPEKVKAIHAAWRMANREKDKARGVAFRKANPDKIRGYYAIRRAQLKGAPVVESIDRASVWARDGGRCHVCGRKVDPANWHLDHLVPLSKGGEHSYRNVAVAHPTCNLRRHNTGPAQLRLDLPG